MGAGSGGEPEVLLVDDDRDWVLVMELALMFAGFRVAHAYSGEDALALIERGEPDAIVLDIALPDIDGWGVLRRLAATSLILRIPVVVVSGRAGGDTRDRVTELGGRAFLAKPCRTADLANTVRSLFTKAGGSPPSGVG
jgi:two-component system OmpR family response regulator